MLLSNKNFIDNEFIIEVQGILPVADFGLSK